MKENVCVIGRFGELSYERNKLCAELKSLLPADVFPWADLQLLFHTARTDVQYIFDENMQKIAQGYEDSNNRAGFLSLTSVTYNLDTFSSADGLYGKVVLQIPVHLRLQEREQLFGKVFYVLQNHVPLREGQKIKIKLPTLIKKLWLKINVEFRGSITQHIFFGTKGDSKKVHIFKRSSESAIYENTPKHHSPKIAPFKQIGGVVVKDGIVHSYHVCPDEIKPNKENAEEKKSGDV